MTIGRQLRVESAIRIMTRWLEWLDSHDGRLYRRQHGELETDTDLIATIPNPPGSAIFTVGDLRAVVECFQRNDL